MKKIYTILILFIACALCTVSCDETYDLNNDIDTNISIGGNFLAFPIGGTKKIKLSELLDFDDENEDEVIQAFDNGNYAIRYKDEIVVDGLSIEPVSITADIPTIADFIFSTTAIEIKPIEIKGDPESKEISLSAIKDGTTPPIVITLDKSIGPLTFPAGEVNTSLPGATSPIFNFDETFELEATLTGNNLQSIEKIYFGTDDKGHLFEFKIDASTFINKLSPITAKRIEGVVITFPTGTELALTENPDGATTSNNEYSVATKEMVNGIANFQVYVKSMPFEYINTINFKVGKIIIQGEATEAITGATIAVKSPNSLTIRNADVTTLPLDIDIPGTNITLPIDIDNIAGIDKVNSIDFTPGSAIKMIITKPILPAGLEITGVKRIINGIEVEGITITFPESMTFAGGITGFNYTDNILTLDIDNVFGEKTLNIERLTLSGSTGDVINGKIAYNPEVVITAGTFTIGSKSINTSGLSAADIPYQSGIMTSTIGIKSSSVVISATKADIGNITTEIIITEEITKEIEKVVNIDMAKVAGAYPSLTINTVFTNIPDGIPHITLNNFSIEFPEIFTFTPDNDITFTPVDNRPLFTSNEIIYRSTDGTNTFTFHKKLFIESFKFGQNNPVGIDATDGKNYIKLDESIEIKGSILVPSTTISTDNIKDIIGTPTVELSEMTFAVVEGIFNPIVDPTNEMFELKDLPDFLKGNDVNLDLINPVIKFEVSNTLDIPIIATATIIPIIKDVEQTANKIDAVLNIKRDDNGTEAPVLSKFWLSKAEPIDQTYEYLSKDIIKLITKIPDFLSINMDVKSDNSEDVENHIIDLTKTYDLKVKYEVEVPLTLGDEFKIVYEDTLKDIGSDLEEVIDKISSLMLDIEVESSVPLNMSFNLTPTDKDLEKIEGIKVEVIGSILSAEKDENATDGSGTKAVKSTISVELSETQAGQLAKLDNLLMTITADATAKTEGASLNKEQSLTLSLKAKIPGGISMDINE